MRAFSCGTCRSLIFFENSVCITCGSRLGFHRPSSQLVVLANDHEVLTYLDEDGRLYRPCANRKLAECNWLAEQSAEDGLCDCCELTRTRPADGDTVALAAFARTEAAKRRLVFQLDFLGLPTTSRTIDPERGLAFDLLSSTQGPVTTGHDQGLITIDLAEGNDAHREALRVRLAEPYRTLLGHLRHEVGHWYWAVLIDSNPFYDQFHALFGDERADYAGALAEHYSSAAGDDWMGSYVSHYAAAHPWEDWAETFAHYLHIRDTLQTCAAWGVSIAGPDLDLSVAWDAQLAALPTEEADEFGGIVRTWLPLTYALNAVNRSMGKDDLYPFVLPPMVLEKLRFVHVVVSAVR
ncbi:MAG: putative zinc-binding peptidase [Actinomycetota bacterium]|nr:putative zinc-binding peptidase [Actinomycetota bacterium]